MGVNNIQVLATILVGQTKSNRVLIPQDAIPVAIFTDPTAMTGTALTFDGALTKTGGSEYPVQDGAGNAYSLTIPTSPACMKLDATLFAGLPYIEVISGSAEAATRVLTIVCQKSVTGVI